MFTIIEEPDEQSVLLPAGVFLSLDGHVTSHKCKVIPPCTIIVNHGLMFVITTAVLLSQSFHCSLSVDGVEQRGGRMSHPHVNPAPLRDERKILRTSTGFGSSRLLVASSLTAAAEAFQEGLFWLRRMETRPGKVLGWVCIVCLCVCGVFRVSLHKLM